MEQNKKDTTINVTQNVMAGDEDATNVGNIINKRIHTFNQQRRSILTEIKCNIAYVVGEQNIQLIGNNIVPLDRERQIESTTNAILPAVQKDMAIGTSMPPIFDFVPSGTDDDDKATAIASQKVFNCLQRRIGRDMKRAEAILWYDLSGVGWRKVYWNPDDAVIGINPPEGTEAHVPGVEVGSAITEGEVNIDLVPTHKLIWDYRISDLTKLPWIIHCDRKSSEWVVERYGYKVYQKLSGKFGSTRPGGESEFEATILNSLNSTVVSNSGDKQQVATPAMNSYANIQLDADKAIDYYEYWQKPTKSMPTGMYAIMLGDQVVEHNPYPIGAYPHGELPFIPASPINIQGSITGGVCRVSQARPIQREINRLSSQIDENADIMGNAIIFAQRGAKIRHKTLDNGSGNIIEYDGPMGKPQREPGVPMNSQIFVHLANKKLALDEIFAFHGPSKGQAPTGMDSGKALQTLQRADILHLGPIVEGFEQADERVVYQAVTIAMKNYPENKMINVVGDDYEWTLLELDKSQLRGKFNVIVKQHSSMPIDKDAEAAQAFQLWGSGLLGDPQDPDLRTWTLNQMQTGNTDALLQKHSKQRNFAKKEFLVAAANLKNIQIPPNISPEQLAMEIERYTFIPVINPFDDHQQHISVHNEWMMDNFWKYVNMNNVIASEFIKKAMDHIRMHQQLIAQMQMAQEQKQLQTEMLLKGKTDRQIILNKMNFDENGKPESNKKDK